MDLHNPIIIQIALDAALFASILILLWRVNTNVKKPVLNAHREMVAELRSLIHESQANAKNFLHALEQGRLTLKELALELDLKEKRVRSILDKTDQEIENVNRNSAGTDSAFSGSKYSTVINMIKKGISEEETSRVTGFTQAEIGLIVDLARIKNENA
jgi:hypothetical protein